jgi:glycosyltransferase involved in cell wall biosynthesis
MSLTQLKPATSVSALINVPLIDPVPADVHRPLWSVMIPTYNRTKYLEQTLRSVLEQAPGPEVMQIEVIDNCSTKDDPVALVERVGQERVSVYRQPHNVGMIANLTTCIQRARGHLVHILHDDDVVLPGFYNRLQSGFEQDSTIGAAFCRYAHVNEADRQQYLLAAERNTPGILTNWVERIAIEQLIQPPAIVVKREVYEALGGYYPDLGHAVDWEMWTRIAAHYPVWYEPQTLAHYRVHAASDTSDLIRSGRNVVDTRKAIEIFQSYLPQATANTLADKARENSAIWSLIIARRMLAKGDISAMKAQIQEALQCSRSPRVLGLLSLLPMLAGMSRIRDVTSAWMSPWTSGKNAE